MANYNTLAEHYLLEALEFTTEDQLDEAVHVHTFDNTPESRGKLMSLRAATRTHNEALRKEGLGTHQVRLRAVPLGQGTNKPSSRIRSGQQIKVYADLAYGKDAERSKKYNGPIGISKPGKESLSKYQGFLKNSNWHAGL